MCYVSFFFGVYMCVIENVDVSVCCLFRVDVRVCVCVIVRVLEREREFYIQRVVVSVCVIVSVRECVCVNEKKSCVVI